MNLKTLDDLDVSGKRVLIRADLNVPVKNGSVADRARIEACAPTIREILELGGRPIVVSHLGRPKGARDPALSLGALTGPLSEAVSGAEVRFADDCIGPKAESVINGLRAGQVALLENLRFHGGETDNDPDFAAALAALADAYVNDAFSAAHRAHASVVGVAERLPAAAGRLMQRELDSLERWLARPGRPYLAILGGAKVETKLGLAAALMDKGADVALAGAMANTVLLAEGREIGTSLCDKGSLEAAKRLVSKAGAGGRELILPADAVVAPNRDSADQARTVSLEEMPADAMILDVGPRGAEAIIARAMRARTLVWNGPLGTAEQEAFARATLATARAIAERTEAGELVSVVGGGDTVAVLRRAKLLERFTYASLAGGAFLAWLQGEDLPGVAVLARGS